MSAIRRDIPLFITGILGGIVLLEYYVQIPPLSSGVTTIVEWSTAIFAIAPLLGLVKFLQQHYKHIRNKEPRVWYHSIWLIIIALFTFFLGATQGTTDRLFEWIYWNLMAQIYISTVVLQSLFSISAAYRAFRTRTYEATIMLLAALIVTITYTPIVTYYFPGISAWGDWLVKVPNLGATRGIYIGAAVGAVAIGFRILLGKEKAFGIGIGAGAAKTGG